MGTNNRERRRQKQLRRQRQHAHQEHRHDGHEQRQQRPDQHVGHGSVDAEILLQLVSEAVHCDRFGAEEALRELSAAGAVRGGQAAVAACLRTSLPDLLASCRGRGWTPSDLLVVGRRNLGAACAPLLIAAMQAELRGFAGARPNTAQRPAGSRAAGLDWAAEVEQLGAGKLELEPGSPCWHEEVCQAVRLVGLLRHLPKLPSLASSSGAGSRRLDEAHRRILERVRALLAKAEATNFPEEADAFTSKAQELLARHSIDRAALETEHSCSVSVRRIWIDDPYVRAKANLLNQVARANRSRAVLLGDLGLAVVTGHEDDLETVELLFTSLLIQATRQLTAVGATSASGARARSRSYRQSFLVAFAIRIGERLSETATASAAAAAAEHGSSLLPVLAARSTAADEAVEGMFGKLERVRSSATDGLGWAAGRAAADLASLCVAPEVDKSEDRGHSPAASASSAATVYQPELAGEQQRAGGSESLAG